MSIYIHIEYFINTKDKSVTVQSTYRKVPGLKKDNRNWNSSKEEIDRIHPGVLVIIDSESDLHPSYFSHVVFVMSQQNHQLYMILVSNIYKNELLVIKYSDF